MMSIGAGFGHSRNDKPLDEAKLNVIARTRGGASLYSWAFGVSIQCGDQNRTLSPIAQDVALEEAANLFNSVGIVEISEYREQNTPRLAVRRCRS
jgi:hypothetical protein